MLLRNCTLQEKLFLFLLLRFWVCCLLKSMRLVMIQFLSNLEAEQWKWESVNKDIQMPIQPASIRELTREYDLCVTGEVSNI